MISLQNGANAAPSRSLYITYREVKNGHHINMCQEGVCKRQRKEKQTLMLYYYPFLTFLIKLGRKSKMPKQEQPHKSEMDDRLKKKNQPERHLPSFPTYIHRGRQIYAQSESLYQLFSTGSNVANEVVNSVLMSGFTVTTSEVKPSMFHVPPICSGVRGSEMEQTLPI